MITFARIDTIAMIIRQEYSEPKAEAINAWFYEMLCDRPVDGGLESVEYEDWVI